LALRLADNQQQPFHHKLPTNSINPSLAIPIWQFFSLQQSSLQQFIFPLQQSLSSNFPSARKKLHQKTSHIQKASIHPKSLTFSFSKSFISSGKQGGGAMVLGVGRDIVTRETCIKQLRKSS
jgi:hypothetical protein